MKCVQVEDHRSVIHTQLGCVAVLTMNSMRAILFTWAMATYNLIHDVTGNLNAFKCDQ